MCGRTTWDYRRCGLVARRRPSRLLILLITLSAISVATPARALTYSQRVLAIRPASLMGYWSLNETSGTTAADSSGNGNNGTYQGTTLNGIIHPDGLSAPLFDGINDWVTIPHTTTLNPSGQLTISVWVNATETTYWRGIVAKTDGATWSTGYGIFLLDTGVINAYLTGYGDGINANYSILSSWVHLAYTNDGSTQRLYQNGTLIAESGYVVGSSTTNDLYIGVQPGGAGWYGSIARVALWNEALDADEISELADPSTTTIAPIANYTETLTLASGREVGLVYTFTVGEITVGLLMFAVLIVLMFRGRR